MGVIRTLDEETVIRIAAGEVIDRPASVVRELVDNALDARTTEIEISLIEGGIFSLEVIDNGIGMAAEDLAVCYHNHTTSKITHFDDLFHLSTLGFRGEALASIASVATLEILSRTRQDISGHKLRVSYGQAEPIQEVGMGYGTIVRVSDLFERIPARKKFLQSPLQEGKLVFRELVKKMLVFPECGFLYRTEGREKFRTPVRNTLLERIVDLFGDIASDLIPFSFETENASVQGFLGHPTYLKPQRSMQFFAVNRRVVEWKIFPFLLSQVYGSLIPPQKYPVAFVFVEMDSADIDINVHPMKREVRFRREKPFQDALWRGLQESLQKALMGQSSLSVSESLPSTDHPYLPQAASPLFVRERSAPTPGERGFFPEPDFVSERTSTPLVEDATLFSSSASLDFDEYRYVGDLFATYLILEKDDEVIVVDQHAAHERIQYEAIRERTNQQTASQELLSPMTLTLTSDTYEEVFSHEETLRQLGFVIEPFGGSTLVIRAIPAVLDPSLAREAFESFVETLESGRVFSSSDLFDETLKQMACKTAVRAHERLSVAEARALLTRLQHTPNATSCPHGRPTFLRFSRRDLEKLFKRTGF